MGTSWDQVNQMVIVDYGMGNLGSVVNAFGRLGIACKVSREPHDLVAASGIVLPGVGAFPAAMQNLRARGLTDTLHDLVIERRKPFLGICLGLQLIATDSTEQGLTKGLGWIDGHVTRIAPAAQERVPHVGWNEIRTRDGATLFARLQDEAHFYFDHSYHLQCSDQWVTASCDYGGRWVAAIQKGNIHAVQFHPEKSQRNGLRVLRNFARYVAEGEVEKCSRRASLA